VPAQEGGSATAVVWGGLLFVILSLARFVKRVAPLYRFIEFARESMTRHTLVYSWISMGDFSEGRIFHYEFTVCVSILKNELLLLVTC